MKKIKRLARSLAWKIFVWTDFSFKLNSGIRLCICNRADFPILQEIFIEKSYAPFLNLLPEICTWVDVGCNCGLFSLYLEDHALEKNWSGSRKAVLIDANRYALHTAKKSIVKNNLENSFFLIDGVVGRRSELTSFYESKSTYKSSIFKLSSTEKGRQILSLDLWETTKQLSSIDLIKIDIEGAECILIEEWMDWLQQAKYILVEWHEPHMMGRTLEKTLTEKGFKLILALSPSYLSSDPRPVLDLPIGSGLWEKIEV